MNKIIVLTGGSSGIGKQLLANFLADGDIVYCLQRTNPHNYANFIECDLGSEVALRAAAAKLKTKIQKIDILLNNAGLGISGAQELLPIKDVRHVVEVDYFAAFILTAELLPLMTAGSKIVNISSACAIFALPFRAVYCSAKAAMNMFSYGLRMELAKSKIDVVTICPGDILTGFTASRIKFSEPSERYGNAAASAANKVDSRESKRMDVIKSGKKIYKIAAFKTKALYIIGAKYKFLSLCQRLLPTTLFLKLTNKFFN